MNLSPHFTLEEFTFSPEALRKGLDNTPDGEAIENLKRTADGLEEVRARLGYPIYITSGFRSLRVNASVGGSSTSQHMKGEACDFICPGFGTPQEICRAIRDSEIEFDQLIYEGGWVHISFSDSPRRSILTAHFSNGRATYSQGVA